MFLDEYSDIVDGTVGGTVGGVSSSVDTISTGTDTNTDAHSHANADADNDADNGTCGTNGSRPRPRHRHRHRFRSSYTGISCYWLDPNPKINKGRDASAGTGLMHQPFGVDDDIYRHWKDIKTGTGDINIENNDAYNYFSTIPSSEKHVRALEEACVVREYPVKIQ